MAAKVKTMKKTGADAEEMTSIEKKKQKNLEKMFNYQSRKRDFKQREPITHDHVKRQRTEV